MISDAEHFSTSVSAIFFNEVSIQILHIFFDWALATLFFSCMCSLHMLETDSNGILSQEFKNNL